MIPFVRTVKEQLAVLKIMEAEGLVRGKHGLQVYLMCEGPSNAICASAFLKHCDGFSIGSNDLTQLTLVRLSYPSNLSTADPPQPQPGACA